MACYLCSLSVFSYLGRKNSDRTRRSKQKKNKKKRVHEPKHDPVETRSGEHTKSEEDKVRGEEIGRFTFLTCYLLVMLLWKGVKGVKGVAKAQWRTKRDRAKTKERFALLELSQTSCGCGCGCALTLCGISQKIRVPHPNCNVHR